MISTARKPSGLACLCMSVPSEWRFRAVDCDRYLPPVAFAIAAAYACSRFNQAASVPRREDTSHSVGR